MTATAAINPLQMMTTINIESVAGECRHLRVDQLYPSRMPAPAGEESARITRIAPHLRQPSRRLARPIQVRVLHPDPALDRRAVSIPEMARSSGGEQLTGAILLYC